MLSDNDTFDDDDDFDIDAVYNNAQNTQHPQTQINNRESLASTTTNRIHHEGTFRQPNCDDMYTIKGENSILKAQIAKLQKEKSETQKLLQQDYAKLLKDKEDYIEALNENLLKIKSENEFLVSENKNLYQATSKKRKLRSIETSEPETSTQNISNSNISVSTENTSYSSAKISKHDTFEGELPMEDDFQTKVLVMNQATFFQDEKTLFIEAVTNYIIPGMPQSTFQYLENISSTFDYKNDDFQISRDETSFKSAILKYLINFQDKNRIDNLLLKFVNILLEYIIISLENENLQLLPVPYLLSLINFSLNYRPKAIKESFIGETTAKIILLISKFQELFKPEFDYLSLPGTNRALTLVASQDKESDDPLNYTNFDKPIHVKILEVFTAIFLMDILTSLSKISSFLVFTFQHSEANIHFWKEIPQQLLTNSFLSRKTPVHFIYNTIDILINSVADDDKFAFGNTRRTPITKQKDANEITVKILEQTIQFLTTIKPTQIHFNVFGLNFMIGSNSHLQLLQLVSIPNGELSSYPRTNSFDTYEAVLKTQQEDFQKQDFYLLSTKLNILNLFESFYSSLLMISLPLHTHLNLIKKLCQLIGEEQEMIIRSPRSPNNGLKVEIISKSVKLIHYLVAEEGTVKINEIPNSTLREMIIVLLRISSKSMKNISIDFVTKLRNMNYNGVLFCGEQGRKELDKYGLWNSILSIDKMNAKDRDELVSNRIQIEIDLYNGIEFNYSDETIDIARDIVGLSVTGDEADRLHDSINFVNDDYNTDPDYVMK